MSRVARLPSRPLAVLTAPTAGAWRKRSGPARRAGGPALWGGLTLLAGLVLGAISLPPFLADPVLQHYDAVLQTPGGAHPLGTDALGRDILARLAAGARVSLIAAFGSQLLALTLGVLVGGAAAQAGPRFDGLLMRLTDAVLAFPALLLIVLLQSLVAGGCSGSH